MHLPTTGECVVILELGGSHRYRSCFAGQVAVSYGVLRTHIAQSTAWISVIAHESVDLPPSSLLQIGVEVT